MTMNRAFFQHAGYYVTDPPAAAYDLEAEHLRKRADAERHKYQPPDYSETDRFASVARRIRWHDATRHADKGAAA